MNGLISILLERFHSEQDSGADALATLILAAREDAAFRQRLVIVLRLPASHREALIRTAVSEMRLRGEAPAVQKALLALSTEEGARTALQLLDVG